MALPLCADQTWLSKKFWGVHNSLCPSQSCLANKRLPCGTPSSSQECMGSFPSAHKNHNCLDLTPTNKSAFAPLTPHLTSPSRYNYIRYLYSPFPMMSHIFHAYLSVLFIEASMGKVERMMEWEEVKKKRSSLSRSLRLAMDKHDIIWPVPLSSF